MNYGSERIRCPHLGKLIWFFCNADKGVYVPSLFQLEEYCRNMAHKKCPFFIKNYRWKPKTQASDKCLTNSSIGIARDGSA